MKLIQLTRQVSLGQMFYEMSAGSQNNGVHHCTDNKGQHKEVKKFKEWKVKKDKKDKKDK